MWAQSERPAWVADDGNTGALSVYTRAKTTLSVPHAHSNLRLAAYQTGEPNGSAAQMHGVRFSSVA